MRSLRPEALAEVLTAEVRAAMLALDACLPTTFSAVSVEASGPLNLSEVATVVARAGDLARALARGRSA